MDISMLLREARQFAKQNDNRNYDLKIAVLGSASMQYFVIVLRYMLHIEKINAFIYEGEYDGITMDVFDETSGLYKFEPEMVIIIPHYLDVKVYPELLCESETYNQIVADTGEYYVNLTRKIGKKMKSHIIMSNFVIPPEHIIGNLENQYKTSRTSFLNSVNKYVLENKQPNTSILDMNEIASCIGKYEWFDYTSYFLSKQPFNMNCIETVARAFSRHIMALKGDVKKCLVLDLDNTLWGGVVGDEGYDGVQLDPNNAIGEAYRYFQSYILQLKMRGIILAVCSKNDEEMAREVFEKNENMILNLNDISCFKANWDDKATNLKAIANELNIGLDSIVFFDDNPAEREIIKQFIPEVYVVDVPKDPAHYVSQLDKECPFEWIQVTTEDLMRSESYIENRRRNDLQSNFVNYDEYLQALQMNGDASELQKNEIERFTQLLNKSNQFNLRTVRYTEADVEDKLSSDGGSCITVRLNDKFSEYGIISCIVLQKREKKCFIESWVMSCRVLKRGIEYMAYERIIQQAKAWECDTILGEYLPTKKNHMVADFYERLGFTTIQEDTNGNKLYEVKVDMAKPPKYYIEKRK